MPWSMTSRAASSPATQPGARFGARAGLAALALVLVAVPFGLLLFLVEDKWPPLLDVDDDARDALHGFAVAHAGFVTAMRTLSTVGSALVYVPLFALVAGWLVWRRRPRLAVFVVVTVAGSVLLNAIVKLVVHRARPVLPDPVAHASGLSFPGGHAAWQWWRPGSSGWPRSASPGSRSGCTSSPTCSRAPSSAPPGSSR